MRKWFTNATARQHRGHPMRSHPNRTHLRLELLEDRRLLSVFPGEIHVNTVTAGDEFDSDNAMDASGRSVVVWTDLISGNSDVKAQRFTSSGTKAGGEIVVAGTSASESAPAVAISGNTFVVVWEENPAGNFDVRGEQFDLGTGALICSFTVAATTLNEFDPDVAAAAGNVPGQGLGAFVVTYTRLGTGNVNDDVIAQMRRTDVAGCPPLTTFFVANSATDESHARVARAADGSFSVAYEVDYSSTDSDIRLERRSPSGAWLGEPAIAGYGVVTRETSPAVAMDTLGNAVVVWQHLAAAGNNDVTARKISNTGALGGFMSVAGQSGDETNPAVALRSNGSFVVAYEVYGGIWVREYNSSTATWVTAAKLGSDRSEPAISIADGGSDDGGYLITFTKRNAPDDYLTGVFGRYGHLP